MSSSTFFKIKITILEADFLVITNIERQKNNNKRYSVFIDNEFAFGIDEIDLLYYKLKIDSEITKDKFEYILNNLILRKAKDTAIKYLGYKARSKKELISKLKEKEFSEEVISRTIEFLEEYNYIDDLKYAELFSREKFNIKGWGEKRIFYELKLKGISEDIIYKTLDSQNFDEASKAESIIIKRLKGKKDISISEKQKLFGYMLRRGFSSEIIKDSLNTVLNSD